MSKRRQSTPGATPEPRDQALRLAVAATTLGMTMGIAPATVLGADEAAAAGGEAPAQVQDKASSTERAGGAYMKFDDVKGESSKGAPASQKKFEKVDLLNRSYHKSEQGAASSAGAAPNASFHKAEQPAAGNYKVEKPPAAAHKDEAAGDAAQKAGKTPGAGGPKYDVAPNKK